ncbi:hypothetical protein A2592_02670 [Candidatus Kaiserbacteria bacterium RIFOXYD1_FULL_42_15]|uniref:Uncharacterized protein n=1 Tax=Candidatus Kaiserbacteria bacterium RIFOXYD1_FULL_42_15 TaxID=1798532 RepID=A0A1F6FQ31_9BACT|nr:MAG: hypothetical protein A2592_02670 [Candidatus Kaiserbacteria bacterium RIFOXYD1_FULL_42_15]
MVLAVWRKKWIASLSFAKTVDGDDVDCRAPLAKTLNGDDVDCRAPLAKTLTVGRTQIVVFARRESTDD